MFEPGNRLRHTIFVLLVLFTILALYYLLIGKWSEHRVNTGLEGQTFVVKKEFILAPITYSIDSVTYSIDVLHDIENAGFVEDPSNIEMQPIMIESGTKLTVKRVTYKNYFEGARHMIELNQLNITSSTKTALIYYNSRCFQAVANNKISVFFKMNRTEKIDNDCIFQNGILEQIP